MPKDKIEKLNKLLEMMQNDTVTPKEIENFLGVVLGVISKAKENFQTISSDNLAKIEQALEFIQSEHQNVLSKIDTKEEKTNNKLDTKIVSFQSNIDAKIKELNAIVEELKSIEYKDGKDADEEVIVSKVISKLPKQETDTAEIIKDKLETLKGKERLNVSAIEGIEIYTSKKDFDFALGVLDQRTQFLINKRSGSGIQSIVAGTNVTVDNTDPLNPIISSTGSGLSTIENGVTTTTAFGASEILFSDGTVVRGNSKFTYNPTTDLFRITDGSDRFFNVDATNGSFGLGDLDGAGVYIEMSSSGQLIQLVANTVELAGNQYKFPAVQGTAGQVLAVDSVSLGTATLDWVTPSSGGITGSGANNQVTFWTGASTVSGSSAFQWNDTTKRFVITNGGSPAKRALQVDAINFEIAMGDTATFINGTQFLLSDASQNVQINGSDGLGTTGAVLDIYTNLSAGHGAIVKMGDVSGLLNGTTFSIDDSLQTITAELDGVFGVYGKTLGLNFLNIDTTTGDVYFGNIDNSTAKSSGIFEDKINLRQDITSGALPPQVVFEASPGTVSVGDTTLSTYGTQNVGLIQFAPFAMYVYAGINNDNSTEPVIYSDGDSLILGRQAGGGETIQLDYIQALMRFPGEFQVYRIAGTGTNPTIGAGTGAGTSPTVSITGKDLGGYITITTGTTPATSATVATVSFGNSRTVAPRSVQITPANAATALLGGVNNVFVPQSSITAGNFIMVSGSVALTGATQYKWFYQTID
jgi:hypothetical protein